MTLYRSDLAERVRALPKVELHQHVDGSIPAEVTWELMQPLPPQPRRLAGRDAARTSRSRTGEEGTLLAYLDKMHYPLWVTQFYENISKVAEAIVDAAAAAGVSDARAALLAAHPHLRRAHPAPVDPRRALGHEPRAAAAPRHEARAHRHRHAPARPPHREDPGPPGHRRGAAPARAHGRRGLRHRRARARQPPAPLQERLRDRAPRAAGAHRPRRRGRARPTTSGRRSTSSGVNRIGHGCVGRRRTPSCCGGWPATRSRSRCASRATTTRAPCGAATPPPAPRLPRGGRAGGPLLRQQHGLAHRRRCASAAGRGAGGHRRGGGHPPRPPRRTFIRPETALPAAHR